MDNSRSDLPRFTPNGHNLQELVSEANRDAPSIERANVYLAVDMGLVIMQPGHPARAEVVEYLIGFGNGCMFGLIPVEA